MKILTGLLTTLLMVFFCSGNPPKSSGVYVAHYENVLGTSLELKVYGVSTRASEMAETAVLQEIARLSAILSGYDPGSEFSRWCRTTDEPVPVSKELYEVLSLFDEWRSKTDGALDASAEVVTRCWKQAAAQGRPPTQEELSVAIATVRETHWRLDPVHHTATHVSTAPLMLNSFAKSYIIRHAADAGRAAAHADAIVVNIGGDIVVAGNHTENIRVSNPTSDAENDKPLDNIRIANKAIATSGNYRRGELIQGRWYSHIVDPRTGQPADSILSATVVASSATDAGALATAFNVMTPVQSVQLAATLPGIDYLIITRDGRRFESQGWSAIEDPAAIPTIIGDGRLKNPAGRLAGDYELVINLEIAPQQGFAKRPYVAVWVEDEDHAPIRTITLWHGPELYLPTLKSWYLKYRNRYKDDKNFAGSVTSATRSAGKYTLKWDGKDDEGNVVKPGKYVLKIEVAREHGTFQLMRQEIDWNESPQKFVLPGNLEVAGVSIDYKKTDQ